MPVAHRYRPGVQYTYSPPDCFERGITSAVDVKSLTEGLYCFRIARNNNTPPDRGIVSNSPGHNSGSTGEYKDNTQFSCVLRTAVVVKTISI